MTMGEKPSVGFDIKKKDHELTVPLAGLGCPYPCLLAYLWTFGSGRNRTPTFLNCSHRPGTKHTCFFKPYKY